MSGGKREARPTIHTLALSFSNACSSMHSRLLDRVPSEMPLVFYSALVLKPGDACSRIVADSQRVNWTSCHQVSEGVTKTRSLTIFRLRCGAPRLAGRKIVLGSSAVPKSILNPISLGTS